MIDIDKLAGLPKPLEWTVMHPYMEEGKLIVPARYTLHGCGSETRGYIKYTNTEFNLEEILPVIKKIDEANHFSRICQLGKIAEKRDEAHYDLLVYLNQARINSPRTSMREVAGDVEGAFLSGEGLTLFRKHSFYQGLILILRQDKRFLDEDIQELLS